MRIVVWVTSLSAVLYFDHTAYKHNAAQITKYELLFQSRPNTQHLIDKLTVAQAHLDRMD